MNTALMHQRSVTYQATAGEFLHLLYLYLDSKTWTESILFHIRMTNFTLAAFDNLELRMEDILGDL